MSARSADLTEKWYEYVYRDREADVRRFVAAYPEERALTVNCDRFGHDYRFVRPLLADPDATLRAGTDALRRFLPDDADRNLRDVYLRVTDPPAESEVALADLRADHLNRLRTVRGVVTEAGPIRPKVVRAGFRCAKCEAVTRHVVQTGRTFRAHAKCPRCRSVGYLSFAPAASEYVDAQEVRLRDPGGVDATADGEPTGTHGDSDGGGSGAGGVTSRGRGPADEVVDPDSGATAEVPVLLEHDLAGEVSAGDEVRLVGVPRANRAEGSTVADAWIESVSMERLTGADR